MAKSLAIVNKDLSVASSMAQIVKGVDKLKQDMFVWLVEAYRIDRFNPKYGSTLTSYIGSQNSPNTRFEIEVEVVRVLTNFQRMQRRLYNERPRSFDMTEILDYVDSVQIVQSIDELHIKIFFTTLADSATVQALEMTVN